ncbi:hypothetical protein ABZ958_37690 [Streptomyces sp. NPDC046237]|uniref:hypothetical protein n=1 Tax=Streptomyces sp. NPDC046237 TaxID=3154914 RepID=UPI003405888E
MDQKISFPPRPLRGVRAVYARQAGCPSDFADVTVDFEPWEEGVAFESSADLAIRGHAPPQDVAAFQAAAADGIREELAALEPGTTVAVAVVLRAMGIHAADSHPRAFHHAGRLAVRNALGLTRPSARPE